MENELWKFVMSQAGEALPALNDYLISDFREDNINKIPEYLDMVFNECILLLGDQLEYLGHTELTPSETLEYTNSSIYTKSIISVNKSTFKILRFSFKFMDEIYSLHVSIPFMENGAIIYEDTKYYPIFPIIERGLYRSRNELRIKVLRAWLKFFRTERIEFASMSDKKYFITIITAKIHQSKRGKNDSKTPLPIYHFTKYGFEDTLKRYGMQNDILLVEEYVANDGFEYIKIKPNIYLKTTQEALTDKHKLRMIGSILSIFQFNKKFTLKQLFHWDAGYFKTTLGKYAYKVGQDDKAYYTHATNFIEMNKTLLDPATIYNLKSLGMEANDIYELLFVMYHNIDVWLRDYSPVDFYDKKIGTLDQMMGFLGRTVFTNLYSILNSRIGLTPKSMKEFVNKSSKKGNWITKSTMFRSNPSIYNDNLLLGIYIKRFRSLENEEVKILDTRAAKSNNIPISLLKSHHTQMVVESILSISSSSPITSGNINPYLEIDTNGNIIRPEHSQELSEVYL